VGNFLLQYRKYGYNADQIYQQIFDARIFNPNSVMPPFGTFGILSDQDIRDLVAFLQSLD
jgi:sulfur-oxidizing protein SoxA